MARTVHENLFVHDWAGTYIGFFYVPMHVEYLLIGMSQQAAIWYIYIYMHQAIFYFFVAS